MTHVPNCPIFETDCDSLKALQIYPPRPLLALKRLFSAVKKICDIYDWDGKGELDLFFLGDIMYAMGYNTTKKVCVGLGQTDEEGKKFAKFDDVVSKVEEALKTPDSQGTYADYVELLKLYDKNQNGTMMLAELDNILCNLGDEIPKEDVQKMFAEICDPEDEDGLFPYMSFLDRLTGKA